MRLLKVLAPLSQAGGSALSALWTFPGMLLSAFLVAWGAEAAQFLISQGLALALLAWLQTSPEFAVEAMIAWEAGKDPARAHLAIANLTGAIRLLLGLGWPLIYFVFAFSGRKDGTQRLPSITLERQHAIEIIGLIPPLLYFLVIIAKQAFGWIDAVVLIALYAALSGVLEMVGIWWATAYLPPSPAVAITFVGAEGIVLMTLALLLSTRLAPMTGGVIALVLFFVGWIGGIALAIGQTFANDTIINIGVGSRLLIPTDGLWHGAIFYLEPSDFLAVAQAAGRARAGNPFFADSALPVPYLLWIVTWILIVLVLANWSFARRDL